MGRVKDLSTKAINQSSGYGSRCLQTHTSHTRVFTHPPPAPAAPRWWLRGPRPSRPSESPCPILGCSVVACVYVYTLAWDLGWWVACVHMYAIKKMYLTITDLEDGLLQPLALRLGGAGLWSGCRCVVSLYYGACMYVLIK